MTPRVAVVIPTYRRDGLLRRCLEALQAQDLPAWEYEVVIADNAGSEATATLVDEFGRAETTFRYVRANHQRGPAAARNVGWRASQAEVIAFTDDDCLPEPGWLRAGLAALGASDAATGKVIMPLPDRPTDYERDAAGLTRAEFVTANCFCRRAALEAIGGFDERFTAAWREDSDLQLSLLERGLRIVPAPEAVVVHPIRPAGWGVSLAQQRKSRFDLLLLKKHPRLCRERIPPFPLDYYGILFGLALAIAGVAIGHRVFALAGLIIWLTLTIRFCFRRLQGTSRHPWHVGEMIVTSLLIPPLSCYWRLRGILEFGWPPRRDGEWESRHAAAHLSADGASRPVQSTL